MTTYPPPGQNPKCVCPNLFAAFFCTTGHMLECHYPMSCDEAQCSHLAGYMAEDGPDSEPYGEQDEDDHSDGADLPELPELPDLPDMDAPA